MEKRDAAIVIAEILIVAAIVLFVINLDRFFPAPAIPKPAQTTITPQVNLSNVKGQVIIVEYSDFACPYCKQASGTIRQIQQSYGNKVTVVFKHFPVHSNSLIAAEASECARDQDMFWQYHDLLFENQPNFELTDLKGYAGQLGLNMTAFNNCLDNGIKAEIVKQNQAEGQSLGVQGTPTFFVNNKELVGAQDASEFSKVIDNELAGS